MNKLIHNDNSPIDGFLTSQKKKKIKIGLETWKQDKSVTNWSEELEKLFWILCEYDHSNAPGNWTPKFKHWEYIGGWTLWFEEDHPQQVSKIIDMYEEENNKLTVCQWGKVNNFLFQYMIDYAC